MSRSVELKWLGSEQLRVTRTARPQRLVWPALNTVLWVGLTCWVGPMTGLGLALLTAGSVLLPLLAVTSFRGFRAVSFVLSRTSGRLLLDGEPLEASRVELRVLRHPLFRVPTGYALSLWALVGQADPMDLDLGRFSNIIDASLVSGQLDGFLERAPRRAAGRLPMGE